MEIKIERKIKTGALAQLKEFVIHLREIDEASFPVAYLVDEATYEGKCVSKFPQMPVHHDVTTQRFFSPSPTGSLVGFQSDRPFTGEESIKAYIDASELPSNEEWDEADIIDAIRAIEKEVLVCNKTMYWVRIPDGRKAEESMIKI